MNSSTLKSRLDLVIETAIASQRLVGAVVLVAKQGELIYHHAAGLADREAGRPMTENTLFRLASVSKPIVSTVAMILVSQGKLALDDNIQTWLPEFSPSLAGGQPAQITVRNLLSHTAGLSYRFFEPDEQGPYALAGVSDGMDNSGISLEENLRRLAAVPLLYAPGTSWGYSLAVDVLGAMLEQVCQQPLGDVVKNLLTGPLDMNDTAFYTANPARLATPYVSDSPVPHRLQEGEKVAAFEDTVGIAYSPLRALDAKAFPSAGAGMISGAHDVMKMLEMLRQGGYPLLTPVQVDEMGRDQTGGLELPDMPGTGFGLGFSVLRDPQAAASPESSGTWRWGGAYGHSWFVDRAAGLSVVAFTNTLYEGMSGAFVNELRDAVYGVKS
ncbi:beta-lactamase family protein [Rahnella sp. Lac-M11]|jgi:CubicO group peptidase (beta-lactamase class C family)|uniref:Beta-lactamase family protein n=1 Tax=Rahnella contaminans TaxID=2703882 RepID=A0A6M2B421_9GAMM|nr:MULTISPECIES: serine hydrolase domain-containing protein [Rahnella]KAB8311354.1 class A beta-lactamase-related serine hydrolase [Rouxiella chamberiensis]MCS3423191.1 CubicO group peptidase (beta-lactamase class C family) [Rahnella sp. BIGb0603]NGX87147.1 beta-lactamase family protein [Rahnella contaminans]